MSIVDALISIVVPYYNRSRSLPRLLASVQAQTYQKWQLIIVDDCSDDSSMAQKIIADLQDERIKYVRHTINKNGAAARNTGIHMADGEYIALLDSDDEWMPDKLQVCLEHLLQTHAPENTICYSAAEKRFEDAPDLILTLPARGKRAEESVGEYLFCHAGLIGTPGIFLRTELAKRICFNEQLKRHQDYDFVLRAENLGAQFLYIDKPLWVWNVLQGERNVARKGASMEFAISWFRDYRKYLSEKAQLSYLSKQLFYIAYRNKKIMSYYKFILQQCRFTGVIKVLFGNAVFAMFRK